MNTNTAELNAMQIEAVCGGTTNKNPTPSKLDAPIDSILNGKNYDAIAQKIADWLNGDNTRTRNVNEKQDIYDTAI